MSKLEIVVVTWPEHYEIVATMSDHTSRLYRVMSETEERAIQAIREHIRDEDPQAQVFKSKGYNHPFRTEFVDARRVTT